MSCSDGEAALAGRVSPVDDRSAPDPAVLPPSLRGCFRYLSPLRILVLGLFVFALLLPAVPAAAHAALLGTTPTNGTLMQSPPTEVVLRFSEPVGVSLGAVKVLGPEGQRVDEGEVIPRAGGREVAVPLRGELGHGTYLVSWRVVSLDSHAISGASTFSVGHPSASVSPTEATAGSTAATVLTVSRFTGFAGLVLLVGGSLFLMLLWPGGRQVRPARRLVWTGWGLVAGSTVVGLLAQGPYAAGLPLTDAWRPALLAEVAGSRYGVAGLSRLMLLLVTAAALARWLRRNADPRRPELLGLGGVLAGVLLATSAAGHASAGELAPVALPADAVHLAGVSVWVGGLVMLVAVLLRRAPADVLTAVLPRWSRLATIAVVAVVVTGLFASWREVRELPALTATTYGRLLLVKVALVAGMLALGALGRRWVMRSYRGRPSTAGAAGASTSGAQPTSVAVRGLRRTVLIEATVAAVVLGVTTALVGTPPARATFAEPYSEVVALDNGLGLQVDVEPLRAGVNQTHIYFTGEGSKAVNVEEVSARFRHPESGDVVPIEVTHASLGHYEQKSVVLPYPGNWRLEVITRTSDIDATTKVFPLRVR